MTDRKKKKIQTRGCKITRGPEIQEKRVTKQTGDKLVCLKGNTSSARKNQNLRTYMALRTANQHKRLLKGGVRQGELLLGNTSLEGGRIQYKKKKNSGRPRVPDWGPRHRTEASRNQDAATSKKGGGSRDLPDCKEKLSSGKVREDGKSMILSFSAWEGLGAPVGEKKVGHKDNTGGTGGGPRIVVPETNSQKEPGLLLPGILRPGGGRRGSHSHRWDFTVRGWKKPLEGYAPCSETAEQSYHLKRPHA